MAAHQFLYFLFTTYLLLDMLNKLMAQENSLRQRIYNFLEHPKGVWAMLVQVSIIILILISVGMVVVEFTNPQFFKHYEPDFHIANNIILVIFTIEYLLRLITAPRKLHFATKPLNIVDFLAIAPNYLEFIVPNLFPTTELRVLRLIRLLRFSRLLRLLMLFRYSSFFKKVFQYHGTIFEAITPILIFFGIFKGAIIFLEMRHLWVHDTNLEQLFAIIGFALGIILAEKIGMTHTKFWQVENSNIELYANLTIFKDILNRMHPGKGTEVVKKWTQSFLHLLHDPQANNMEITKDNEILYKEIAKIEPKVADIHNYYLKLLEDAFFCLSKKKHLTPKAYDTLLHQATLLYLLLIAVFIPGITGLISVIVAAYVLYGMYYLTQDMDTIIAGEFSLINIRTTELESLLED